MAEFKRTDTIAAEEVTPETLADRVKNLFDAPAQVEITKATASIIEWARSRFTALGIELNAGYTIDLGLNAYNETYGWGIQSVAVGFRKDGQELRSPGQHKDSTIGVIAPDLIREGVVGIIGVPLQEGYSEDITSFTPGLRFDSANQANLTDDVPAIVDGTVTIDGPRCARTVVKIEASKATLDDLNDDTDGIEPNRGAYVCDYR